MKCGDCQAYVVGKYHCHKHPQTVEKLPDDWCMEFLAKEALVSEKPAEKEVIPCPAEEPKKVEEKAKAEKAKVSEPAVKQPDPHKGRFHKR